MLPNFVLTIHVQLSKELKNEQTLLFTVKSLQNFETGYSVQQTNNNLK